MGSSTRLAWIGAAALLVAAAMPGSASADPPARRGHRIEITVDGAGYHPASVSARRGRRVTLVFTRTSNQGCGGVVVFPDRNIRRELPLNQPVAITITPRRTGSLRFTCGMGMYRGTIVVEG